MERIPFNPTGIEYAECLTPVMYEGYSERAVFNTSIAVTHALMVKGKKLVSTDRSVVDYKIISSQENINYWKANKPPRKNADLTDINAKRLAEIRRHYVIKSNVETISFCLKTLRVYTDSRGTEVISKFVSEQGTTRYAKATGETERTRFYLDSDLALQVEEMAKRQGKSKSLVINELVRKALES